MSYGVLQIVVGKFNTSLLAFTVQYLIPQGVYSRKAKYVGNSLVGSLFFYVRIDKTVVYVKTVR